MSDQIITPDRLRAEQFRKELIALQEKYRIAIEPTVLITKQGIHLDIKIIPMPTAQQAGVQNVGPFPPGQEVRNGDRS